MPKNMNNQLTTEQMISTIRNGLENSQSLKHIIVVGAGMAGLVATSLLKGTDIKSQFLKRMIG